MKKQLALLILLFLVKGGFAQLTSNNNLTQYYINESQACGGITELFKIKGKWKKATFGDDLSFPDKTFPSKQYKLLFDRIEKVLPLVKAALPDLGGFEPVWHGSIRGNSNVVNGPVPFAFRGQFFKYFCNPSLSKIELEEETSASLVIQFNAYGFFCDKIADWDIHGKGKHISIYKMPEVVGQWKGLRLYEPQQPSGPGNTTSRAVVLGHQGKMPWHILTRLEYLTGYKNELDSNRKAQLKSSDIKIKKMKENIAQMKSNPNLAPEQQKSIVEKLENQLAEFQQGTAQKMVEIAEKTYAENIRPVNEYLDTASSETLQQPAILPKKNQVVFKGYFAAPEEDGVKLMVFPSKYYRKELPRYVPQFIVVYWRIGQHPVNLNIAKQFEAHFPIDQLQAMIDQ